MRPRNSLATLFAVTAAVCLVLAAFRAAPELTIRLVVFSLGVAALVVVTAILLAALVAISAGLLLLAEWLFGSVFCFGPRFQKRSTPKAEITHEMRPN